MPANRRKPIVRFGEIQDLVKAYFPDADLDLVRAAYVYSASVHQGQTRRSGEPYLVHPVAVAGILAQMRLDEASVATGFLHDTVEDTIVTLSELEEQFGKEIGTLVDGVTKIGKFEFQSKEERQAENFRKMILAMCKDIRVLLIKLADRLHNMRTLDHMPRESQIKTATETMDIYVPLASRLGIHWMWAELADLAFRYLNQERYETIRAKLEENLKQTEEFKNEVLRIIEERLKQYKIRFIAKGRTKEIWSIQRKMEAQHLDFDQVHDLTAFRVVVNGVNECYGVLGLIHNLWKPVPGRFKDYVAMPKPNGYQSLHTTVIGPKGRRIEIQIRTHEMDLVAEEGIAAHWSYKEGKAPAAEDAQVVGYLRQMMESHLDVDDPREFLDSVRVDLYPDEVYVFTPKGEVKPFPRGSTPLDFAYSIHSEVGHRCVGARVDGKMVPLKYELHNGNTVEIMTSAHQKPSKDWLKFVKTGRARTKIRHFVLAEERQRAVQMGRDSAERELRKWRIELSRVEKEKEILKIAQDLSFKTEEDLFAAIGYGRVSAKSVVTKIVPPQDREKAKAALLEEGPALKTRSTGKSGVRIQGLADVMVNFAKCCSPLPGDPISGYITRGRGITIHKGDCPNLRYYGPSRIVEASWDEDVPVQRAVSLSIRCDNRIGMLQTISGVFSSNNANIVEVKIVPCDDTSSQGRFKVQVRNLEHLNTLINALRGVKGVQSVERMGAV